MRTIFPVFAAHRRIVLLHGDLLREGRRASLAQLPNGGSGDRVGSFQSGVAAIGPELGYVFNVGDRQWYANLRGYYEFWAQNRVQGFELFLTLNMSHSGPPANMRVCRRFRPSPAGP
jgi:hypothetical protein